MGYSCIIIDDEPHAIGSLNDLIEKYPQLTVEATFLNIQSALSHLNEKGAVDVIFSDISMPELNGLEAAKILNDHCRFLIFVTAHPDYSLQAYRHHAAGYLLKPVSFITLVELIDTLIKKDQAFLHGVPLAQTVVPAEQEELIFVKGNRKNKFYKINVKEIYYITAELNYSRIFTDTEEYSTYILLGELEAKLKHTETLFRVNKSTIVSLRYVESIDGNTVYLTNKKNFPIGNVYKPFVHELIKNHSLNL